jgi:uncharacterized protein YecT (DUF1311 family)
MYLRTMLIAVSCLSAATPGFCQRNAEAEECFSLDGQAAALACLETRYQASEVALREEEVACDKAINAWDESTQVRRRTRAALQDTARKFRDYRSSQCDLQAALASGGSGAPHRRLMCAIELNEQRIKYLQEIGKSLK